MSLKFVIANDIHYQGSNPRGRTDDYPAAIEAKVRDVYQVAEAEHAQAILIPGDLCNTPEISRATYRKLFWLLRESPCEILTIHGSPDHDGLAAAMERQWYQLLIDAGIIQDVASGSWSSGNVVITGAGTNPETDHGLGDYLPRCDNRHSLTVVHLAHGMLLERAPGNDFFRYSLMDDVAAQPNAPDVLVCGHYHPGWGIKRIGKTLFINPGALARVEATVAEMERTIQIAVLEIDDREVSARLVPIQSARPGHEVLSRKHLEVAAARAEMKSRFMADLGAGEELRQIEIDKTLDMLGAKEPWSKGVLGDVLADARKRIAAAREGKAG